MDVRLVSSDSSMMKSYSMAITVIIVRSSRSSNVCCIFTVTVTHVVVCLTAFQSCSLECYFKRDRFAT